MWRAVLLAMLRPHICDCPQRIFEVVKKTSHSNLERDLERVAVVTWCNWWSC